jgi:hypothetical protein
MAFDGAEADQAGELKIAVDLAGFAQDQMLSLDVSFDNAVNPGFAFKAHFPGYPHISGDD